MNINSLCCKILGHKLLNKVIKYPYDQMIYGVTDFKVYCKRCNKYEIVIHRSYDVEDADFWFLKSIREDL